MPRTVPGEKLGRPLVWLMAVATGLAVANNYYAQPLLADIGRDLHLPAGASGLMVTVAQVGYAAGLVFLLPLGDLLDRRRLVVGLGVGTAAALAWLAVSSSTPGLMAAAVAVGALSVQAQVLVPFAASLAADEERGRVVGAVMSGLLLGILLARTVAGSVAAAAGWRAVYGVAAAAMLAQSAALAVGLPRLKPTAGLRYPAALASVVALLGDEPLLRRRCLYGALSFGGFSVLWTAMAFLLSGPPYHYGTATIGLFGLAGAAGAVAANGAGRLADRGRADTVTMGACVVLGLSWLALWAGGRHLGALLLGIVTLDVAAQGLHITNQSLIYRLAPEARSRVTSAYMTCYFAGGAAGSALAAWAWSARRWPAVCLVGGGFGAAAAAVGLVSRPRAFTSLS
ncbi:MAG TPA: MFS transporter [Acidimicrobiales bacterium]|nr:MFS transporter [Acidimicrobiales bacterium]